MNIFTSILKEKLSSICSQCYLFTGLLLLSIKHKNQFSEWTISWRRQCNLIDSFVWSQRMDNWRYNEQRVENQISIHLLHLSWFCLGHRLNMIMYLYIYQIRIQIWSENIGGEREGKNVSSTANVHLTLHFYVFVLYCEFVTWYEVGSW